MGFIYIIKNNINSKVYIGQTRRTIERRWYEHKYESTQKENSGYDMLIHKAFRKYGIDNFYIEILEECNNSMLDEREKYWISFYKSNIEGYNTLIGGKPFSEEENKATKRKTNIDVILELYKKGYTQLEIADKLNCSRTAILNCLKSNGVSNPRGWKKTKIGQYNQKGELINVYSSQKEASEFTKIYRSGINKCLNNQQKTAGGFYWKRIKN